MRHEVWDAWLTAEKTADFVIEYLRDANFDPNCTRNMNPK